MNAQANALVTTSNSFNGLQRDAKLRILAYLRMASVGASKDNVTAMKNAAVALQGWNDDLQLDALIFALATLAGLSTNGPDLQAVVDSKWGIPNGIVDAGEVTQLLWYGELLEYAANLTKP